MIDTQAKQTLLPPATEALNSPSSWLDWLTNPVAKQFMLPVTGLLIMGLDWLLFSEEAATLGFAVPMTSVVGFLLGSLGTYHLQTRYAGDSRRAAWLKSLLGGVLVGIPFPLAGTIGGAWILANSGLLAIKNRLWKERFARR